MIEKFIKLNKSAMTLELLEEDPKAFLLLTQIALRAKRTIETSLSGIEMGEALIGDYEKIGLTHQEYRTRKDKLEKWKFATFKTTTKGTIAKLVDKRVYDINEEVINKQINNQVTNDQQTTNNQATTNKNDKNERMIRMKEVVIKSGAKNEDMDNAPRLHPMENFYGMKVENNERYHAFAKEIAEKQGLSLDDTLHEFDKFFNYWKAKNPNGKKELWEMQKVFDLKSRMNTWFSRIRGPTKRTVIPKF